MDRYKVILTGSEDKSSFEATETGNCVMYKTKYGKNGNLLTLVMDT